jgi:hypothetical protein
VSSLWDDLGYLLRQIRWREPEVVTHFQRTLVANVPREVLEAFTPAAPRGVTTRYATLRAYVADQPRGQRLPQIARGLGLEPSTLAGYLGGFSVPRRLVALRLARTYHIDLEGLLDPPDVPRREPAAAAAGPEEA